MKRKAQNRERILLEEIMSSENPEDTFRKLYIEGIMSGIWCTRCKCDVITRINEGKFQCVKCGCNDVTLTNPHHDYVDETGTRSKMGRYGRETVNRDYRDATVKMYKDESGKFKRTSKDFPRHLDIGKYSNLESLIFTWEKETAKFFYVNYGISI